MSFRRVVLVLSMLGSLSCSSTKAGETTPPPLTKLTFSTGEFEVPPGDQFECFYTSTFTPQELGVQKSYGQQAPGGHHITVYYTDISRPPQHHPCQDSEMVQWHMVGGTGGDDGAVGTDDRNLGLPPGYALKVPKDKQLVMQVHYINTTGKPKTVNDSVTLELLQPSQVKAYANYFVSSNEEWTIPAKAKLESSSTCTLKQDLDAILILGHMHEFGTHYKLERVDDTGKSLEVIYEKEWQVSYTSHAPLLRWPVETPYKLKAGTKLRQTCNWNNTSDESIIFPREMCVFFGFYYPDRGELYCEKDKK